MEIILEYGAILYRENLKVKVFKLLSKFFLKFFSFIECFFALSENKDHFEMAMRNFFEKKSFVSLFKLFLLS